MGKVISVSIQKGGVSKTTSTVAIAYLLSEEYKKKVLLIDFDSQGNASFILTRQSPYDFRGRSVLEAIKEEKHKDYILPISDTLDLLPSNAFLASLSGFLYTTYRSWGRKTYEALRNVIKDFKDDYDYIIIDTPPNIGDLTINALMASDFTIIPMESSMLSFIELDPQLELIEEVKKENNPNLTLLGVLVNVIDKRRTKDNREFFEAMEKYYPGMSFKTVIHRTADASRIAKYNLYENPKQTKIAFQEYEPFIKELFEHGI